MKSTFNIIDEAGKLAKDLLLKNLAQAWFERFDAKLCRTERSPDTATEELLLASIALCRGAVTLIIIPILQDMPAETKVDVLVLGKLDELCFSLGARMEGVGFRDDA